MDHRSVPVEVLREFARSYAELRSIRAIAEDAGVGRSTVHKFITSRTMPHPRVRRRLALWYLRRLNGIDEIELVRPYVAALSVLLADVPEPVRRRAIGAVLDSIHGGCVDGGGECPRWLDVLRERTGARP